MNIKKCPACNQIATTTNSKAIGRLEGAIYFNHDCGSTLVLGRPARPCAKSWFLDNSGKRVRYSAV